LSNGVYRLFPDEGTYTTSVIGGLPNSYSVSPLSAISEFTGLDNTDIVDFCVVPTVLFNDLNIVFYPSINEPQTWLRYQLSNRLFKRRHNPTQRRYHFSI